MNKLTHHQKIYMATHISEQLSAYLAAEQRGDLVALARLGRTGKKRECKGYGNMYTWRHGQLTIYIDEPKPFMMIIDSDIVVCSTINELFVPGPWFDKAMQLATALRISHMNDH